MNFEKKASHGSYMETKFQLAQNTFANRFGSTFDAAILGKAMLNSIGLELNCRCSHARTKSINRGLFFALTFLQNDPFD